MKLEVAPLPAGVGVRLAHVDLATASDAVVDALRTVVEDHGLAVVPGQELGPARQLDCTRRFGRVQDTPAHPSVRAHPGVTALSNRPSAGFVDVGGFWHADGIFLGTPSRFSLVSVKDVPASGATTHVVDTVALHADLPQPTRRRLASTWVQYRDAVVHPVVIAGPDRAPAVYCSATLATAVHGPDADVADLLWEVDAQMEARGDDGRVQLRSGDVLIWDNLRIAHRAGEDPGDGLRLLHRTTTAVPSPAPLDGGGAPQASGPGWTPVGPRPAGALA